MLVENPIWPAGAEVSTRVERLKENMANASLDAMVFTAQHNFEYYSGFRSLFWLSDTRPFLAIVRRDKPGVSILVNRGEEGDNYSHVHVVPYDGFTDAAIDAAADFLSDLPTGSAIGLDYGLDMNGRGSVALLNFLQEAPRHFRVTDAAEVIWQQRMVKSEHEFQAKRAACKIATDAFFAGLADVRFGISEYELGQLLKRRMAALGADSVDWLPVRFGTGGMNYAAPNSDRKLVKNDFIWVDMGVRRGDQISDLNRIAKAGNATQEQEYIYAFVRDVTLRLAEGIRPGITGDDAFSLFKKLWSAHDFSKKGKLAIAGRVGHGSGMSLTEPPSLMLGSTEVILENMVLHVEPKIEIASGVFQLEEVFRVTKNGPEFLSEIAPAKLPTVEL
ncbi:M24 family metallopeptidase [Sinorhizobium meliloti]|uniref:M24 family metallopeptidase n=1 Tax=Rhizobium meliloti TaxID=382 RepID=UPI000FDAAD79|nr:Xaa-Pro peptidase family protein [Sinorhizobium meliloti]RVK31282.1 aminopeptidase P family protein [Sinorhizobium meliloti]